MLRFDSIPQTDAMPRTARGSVAPEPRLANGFAEALKAVRRAGEADDIAAAAEAETTAATAAEAETRAEAETASEAQTTAEAETEEAAIEPRPGETEADAATADESVETPETDAEADMAAAIAFFGPAADDAVAAADPDGLLPSAEGASSDPVPLVAAGLRGDRGGTAERNPSRLDAGGSGPPDPRVRPGASAADPPKAGQVADLRAGARNGAELQPRIASDGGIAVKTGGAAAGGSISPGSPTHASARSGIAAGQGPVGAAGTPAAGWSAEAPPPRVAGHATPATIMATAPFAPESQTIEPVSPVSAAVPEEILAAAPSARDAAGIAFAEGASAVRQSVAPAAPVPMEPAMRVIADAVVRSNGDSVEVSLSPEELGRVRISFSQGEGGLTVQLVAERDETLALLRRHADQLAQALKDMGFGSADIGFGDRRGQSSPEGHRPVAIGAAGLAEPADEVVAVVRRADGAQRVDLRL